MTRSEGWRIGRLFPPQDLTAPKFDESLEPSGRAHSGTIGAAFRKHSTRKPDLLKAVTLRKRVCSKDRLAATAPDGRGSDRSRDRQGAVAFPHNL